MNKGTSYTKTIEDIIDEAIQRSPSHIWTRISKWIPWTRAWHRRRVLKYLQPTIDNIWKAYSWNWEK